MNSRQQHTFLTKQQGFTLIELVVIVVIASILLTIAVPSYQEFVRKNQVTTNSNNLISALNFARSEAIKRSVQVTIRRKGTVAQEWDGGWDIFSDLDGLGTFTDDGDANLCEVGEDCLLRTFPAIPKGYTLRTGANYATWLSYLPNGSSKSPSLANDTFRLCSSAADTSKSRSIIISTSGRPRTQTGTVSCP